MYVPTLPEAVPTRGSRFSRGLGKAVLKTLGWRFEGTIPNLAKMVVIVAPHTSNWDFVVGMAAALALGLDVRFLGKAEVFRPPLGWLMRRLGGLPVDRTASQGVVAQVVEAFNRRERLVLGLSPEGTRQRVAHWRTGFYHIALGAHASIVPAVLDYARKVVGVGPPLQPTGDFEADLKILRSVYAGVAGKRPDQFEALPFTGKSPSACRTWQPC